jgi:ABC-type uncharacterized transport system permease subunit
VRYGTVIFGSALAGLAGASLSIGLLNIFQENMTNGMGYIAVALVYFGGWRPAGRAARRAALQHGQRLPACGCRCSACRSPSDLAVMLPYMLTIVVLASASSRFASRPR